MALVAAAATALAQPRQPPHIGFVYPAGAQQGTTVTLSIGGQNLLGATAVYFDGAGIDAKVTGYDRPMTQKEINDLREKVQQLQDKRVASRAGGKDAPTFTVEDEKTIVELRQKLANRPNRPANPAIAETTTVQLTLAADAGPGIHELRLRGPNGLSNPLAFIIGQLPEFTEPVVTATMNTVPRVNRDTEPRTTARPKPADLAITLPTIVNGQILPGEVDRYRFAAKKGQRLTLVTNARSLIPYLADAVPGWFQATLALYDDKGRELAYDDDFRFSPDPVLSVVVPADGDYVVEIKDAIYRGREDFVYRIAIGELPFVTGIFPLGCPATKVTTFELRGWNLPAATATLDTSDKAAGVLLISVPSNGYLSNSVRFALDALPESTETEPNDGAAAAQSLALPMIVNGRIDRPGDQDVYRFDGHAGEQIVAEVVARRLNSPLDSTLTLTDAGGHTLAFNDDNDDKGAGLLTHQADSRISFKLPADGVYYVRIADAQHQGGPDFGYRLRVGAPRPDFELRTVPSTINARAGTAVPITVYALRHDGFSGEIQLALRNPPAGCFLSGARIPAGQDKVTLTLTMPATGRDDLLDLTMVGLATIGGQRVGHVAVPSEDMMQAFAYHHLVPMHELKLCVTGRGPAFRPIGRLPLQIPIGGTARLQIGTPAARFTGDVRLEWAEPVDGVTFKVTPGVRDDLIDVTFTADPAKAKSGLHGNLILNAFGERTNPKAKNAARQRSPLGTVQAIPFELVGGAGPPPSAE
jgi:hypothetical protein